MVSHGAPSGTLTRDGSGAFLSTTAPAGIDTASALGAADGRDYRQWYIPTDPYQPAHKPQPGNLHQAR